MSSKPVTKLSKPECLAELSSFGWKPPSGQKVKLPELKEMLRSFRNGAAGGGVFCASSTAVTPGRTKAEYPVAVVQALLRLRTKKYAGQFTGARSTSQRNKTWSKITLELNTSVSSMTKYESQQLQHKYKMLKKQYVSIKLQENETGNRDEPIAYPEYWEYLVEAFQLKQGLGDQNYGESIEDTGSPAGNGSDEENDLFDDAHEDVNDSDSDSEIAGEGLDNIENLDPTDGARPLKATTVVDRSRFKSNTHKILGRASTASDNEDEPSKKKMKQAIIDNQRAERAAMRTSDKKAGMAEAMMGIGEAMRTGMATISELVSKPNDTAMDDMRRAVLELTAAVKTSTEANKEFMSGVSQGLRDTFAAMLQELRKKD